jgi:hypothetical protein
MQIDMAWLVQGIAAFLMLGMWSIVFYKENPWSRFVEYSTVSMGAAYLVLRSTKAAKADMWDPLIGGDWLKIVPLVLTILVFIGMYVRPLKWTIRWPYAVTTALVVALAIRGAPGANIIMHWRALAVPLTGGAFEIVSKLIMIISVLGCIAYFTYTREHTGIYGYLPKTGRYAIMIGLGTMFGLYVTGNLAKFISALDPILAWLGVI